MSVIGGVAVVVATASFSNDQGGKILNQLDCMSQEVCHIGVLMQVVATANGDGAKEEIDLVPMDYKEIWF
ncbi:hypothetical protein L1049_019817 [Liquidambar formosana]|uniref:Uncharacterized protein n=1 Tax=Liquidambar formosana TaxID=63359 RepID=A0AAP0S799_LIQFO